MAPYDPPNAFYTEVRIPEYIDVLRFIGRDGYHLKNITERSGTQYIWMDMERRVVEIWGRESRLGHAIALTKGRIRKLTRVWVPDVFRTLEDKELKQRLHVTSWEIGNRTLYDVVGNSEDAEKFFDHVVRRYPFNPYMTQIEKRAPGSLLIMRFSSCD
jgi:hypothetical protein